MKSYIERLAKGTFIRCGMSEYLADEVKHLHALGHTQLEMASILKCGKNTVRRRMKSLGLKPQSVGSRSFTINSNIFANIDSEVKAYWLGFLLADGCISKSAGTRRVFKLSLQARDFNHIKILADLLGYKGKFHDDYRNNHHRKTMVFNDVKLCNILLNHGWWEYKCGDNQRILNIVPIELRKHFIRGYFDGDGCISYHRRKRPDGEYRQNKDWYINIVCKYKEPLDIISKWVLDGCNISRESKMRKTVYAIVWNGNNQVSKLLDWMYHGATVSLHRKNIRRLEFTGVVPFAYKSINSFIVDLKPDELLCRKDWKDIVDKFTDAVISNGWSNPKFNISDDWEKCLNCKPIPIVNETLKPTDYSGNKIVQTFQPDVYRISQNRKPPLSKLIDNRSLVKRASHALLTTRTHINPQRFIRELRFAGFTMASLLPVQSIISCFNYFGLMNAKSWFDPCAGWGNRLIASKIMNIDYICTDPGVSYNGLSNIKDYIKSNAIIYNKRWEDVVWQPCEVVMTSPPFHNKEDYLDNAEYGKFEDWYISFLKPLIDRSLLYSKNVILHTDEPMRSRIESDYNINCIGIAKSNKHKVSDEWFVKIVC